MVDLRTSLLGAPMGKDYKNTTTKADEAPSSVRSVGSAGSVMNHSGIITNGAGPSREGDGRVVSNASQQEEVATANSETEQDASFLANVAADQIQQRAQDVEYLRSTLGDRFTEWELSNGVEQATEWAQGYVKWFSDNAASGIEPEGLDPDLQSTFQSIRAEVQSPDAPPAASEIPAAMSHTEVMERSNDPEFLKEVFGTRYTEWEQYNGADQANIWAQQTIKWFADNAESGVEPEILEAAGFVDLFVMVQSAIEASKGEATPEEVPEAADYSDPEVLTQLFGEDFEWMVESQGLEAAVKWGEEKANHWAETSAAENKWGEAELTTMDDVYGPDGELKVTIPEDGVLYIGYGPEDQEYLNLSAEADTIGSANDVVSLFNPTDEVLQALMKDSGVTNVVVGGHGKGGDVFTVAEDGTSRQRSGEEFAALFEGTAVENLFLNICQSAQGGAEGVAAVCRDMGMEVLGWADSVQDAGAIMAAKTMVEISKAAENGGSVEDMQRIADAYDGEGGNLLAFTSPETTGLAQT